MILFFFSQKLLAPSVIFPQPTSDFCCLCPFSSPHCVAPLCCPGAFYNTVAACSGHTRAEPRDMPTWRPSASGRRGPCINATTSQPPEGLSQLTSPHFLRGSQQDALWLPVIVISSIPLLLSVSFLSHLSCPTPSFLPSEITSQRNYLHPSSCLRFSLGSSTLTPWLCQPSFTHM